MSHSILLVLLYQEANMHQQSCAKSFAMQSNHAKQLILFQVISLGNLFASCLKTGIILNIHIIAQVAKNVILSIFTRCRQVLKLPEKFLCDRLTVIIFRIILIFIILTTKLPINKSIKCIKFFNIFCKPSS